MSKRQLDRLIRRSILPSLRDFVLKDGLLLRLPIKPILRGFVFESSSKTHFYLWLWVQPTYVPAEHVYLNLGQRIGRGFDLADGAEDVMRRTLQVINKRGLPVVESIRNPHDLASYLVARSAGELGVLEREVVAYSLAVAGDVDKALDALNELIEEQTAHPDRHRPEKSAERVRRASRLKQALMAGDDHARRILDEWTSSTLKNLELDS